MKRTFAFAILLAASLCGCAGTNSGLKRLADGPSATEGITLAAIATEERVAASCPQNIGQLIFLNGIRVGFDATAAPRLAPDQIARVEAARTATNRICGLVESAPQAEPPEPPGPAPATI